MNGPKHADLDNAKELPPAPSRRKNVLSFTDGMGIARISIPPDGNCLFRAVVVGVRLSRNLPPLAEAQLSEVGAQARGTYLARIRRVLADPNASYPGGSDVTCKQALEASSGLNIKEYLMVMSRPSASKVPRRSWGGNAGAGLIGHWRGRAYLHIGSSIWISQISVLVARRARNGSSRAAASLLIVASHPLRDFRHFSRAFKELDEIVTRMGEIVMRSRSFSKENKRRIAYYGIKRHAYRR